PPDWLEVVDDEAPARQATVEQPFQPVVCEPGRQCHDGFGFIGDRESPNPHRAQVIEPVATRNPRNRRASAGERWNRDLGPGRTKSLEPMEGGSGQTRDDRRST